MKQATGTDKKLLFREYDDLDRLAEGWNKKETERFLKNIKF